MSSTLTFGIIWLVTALIIWKTEPEEMAEDIKSDSPLVFIPLMIGGGILNFILRAINLVVFFLFFLALAVGA